MAEGAEFDFSEFVDKHGYKDKTTYVKTNFKIPTFQDLIEWAVKQDKLKLLILKLVKMFPKMARP